MQVLKITGAVWHQASFLFSCSVAWNYKVLNKYIKQFYYMIFLQPIMCIFLVISDGLIYNNLKTNWSAVSSGTADSLYLFQPQCLITAVAWHRFHLKHLLSGQYCQPIAPLELMLKAPLLELMLKAPLLQQSSTAPLPQLMLKACFFYLIRMAGLSNVSLLLAVKDFMNFNVWEKLVLER